MPALPMIATSACACIALACCQASPAQGSPPDAIRVGALSAPRDPKVAIVVSDGKLVGERFSVRRLGGGIVLRGRLERTHGSPSPWRHAARADLSRVNRPGSYRIRVGRLHSAPWRVSTSARRAMILRLLAIFRVNADGNEPNPVFGPAHLNDSMAPIVGGPTEGGTIDVSGGWRDAGDAVKFTVTTAMASALLDYTAELDPADAAKLHTVSDIGVRWLEKTHPAGSDTFVAQVSGVSDHKGATFRDYSRDDASPNPAFSHRKAYGEAGSGTLGAAAAALASGSLREGPATARGSALLQRAQEWFARGKAVSAAGPRLEGLDQAGGMPFTDWQSFMALASVLLWRAGGDEAYLNDAARYMSKAPVETGFSSYFSVGGLAAADMCGGMGRPAVPREDLRSLACRKLIEAVRASRIRAASNAFHSPGGFNFGWVADHTGSAAIEAAADRANVVSGGFRRAYEARDYLLGRNPWGAGFVVGPTGSEAHHPHHPVVLKGSPARLGKGLVVGGPADRSEFTGFELRPRARSAFAPFNPTYDRERYGGDPIVYEDRTADFITSEPSIGYSGPALLLLSQLDTGGG